MVDYLIYLRNPQEQVPNLNAYFKEKDKIFKYLISLYEKDIAAGAEVAKPVEIIEVRKVEELRGMTERTFIENSYVIEPKTKKTEQE